MWEDFSLIAILFHSPFAKENSLVNHVFVMDYKDKKTTSHRKARIAPRTSKASRYPKKPSKPRDIFYLRFLRDLRVY